MIVNNNIMNIKLVYILTWLRNVWKVIVPNSPNFADKNNKNDGNIAPISVKRNIFDLLSFMNSSSMKSYIVVTYEFSFISDVIIRVKKSSKFSSHRFIFSTFIPLLTNISLILALKFKFVYNLIVFVCFISL